MGSGGRETASASASAERVWVAQHVFKQKDEKRGSIFRDLPIDTSVFGRDPVGSPSLDGECVSRVSALRPSYRRASSLDTHLHAYTMASIAKFSVAPKVAAARHGRFAGSRVSKVRAPTSDSGIARRGHVFG